MEDDNEILDWGNEDDEHHESLKRPLVDSYRRDIGDLDAEDSISLGDEDEHNQEYRNESNTNGSANAREIMESQRRASTPQQPSLTIGAKQDSHGEATHEKLSTPRRSSFSEDSPRRKQHSSDRASPQRSQPNPGRLTHALPPKPVATKVPPYLPPSHPSIVEATSMIISTRAGGRETKKNNGGSSTAIPSTADELPQNWEYRESRNGEGRYYYNIETHVCTWEKPVSSLPSASNLAESRSRRHRSSSAGRRHRTPPDSNPHQSQTSRASRSSAHMPPDREMDDSTKTALPVLPALSYEDRHYRPAAEPSSAVVEIRAMDRHSDVMNGRGSSRSRYDRMPPASPPPSRKRARSLSPHESSWRGGRRNNDDDSMLDEHPDSRNKSSLRRRENSHESNRYQDLPPRPSELHEDANQNPVYLSAPRRGSRGSPAYARDSDRHYEPIIRDYRVPPEEDPRPIASLRDKSLRHDRPAPINIVPAGSEVSSNRQRDRDLVPSSYLTHPSRRVSEREYDRNRREQQILERDGLPRRPAEYPSPTNQIPEQTKGHYDREPLRPHPSDFDRSAQDHVGQSSHRKRAPLPPQATTFLTSSIAPEYARDAPPQSSTAPVAPRSLRDYSGHDSNVPLGPRSMTHVNEEPLSRNGATGGAEYDRDRGRNTSRQPNHYPASAPPINSSMNVDDREGRMDRYSRSRGRTAEHMKAPSQPSSGTNNIPIGSRRSPYNPDARPPPSTLIDPVKARELLPPGKESYERPADLEIADTSQVKTTNDSLIHNTSRPIESAERQPTLAPTPAKPQRKSRFDKPAPQPEPKREPSPISDKGMIQSEASNMRAATTPPLSRDPSVQSIQDEAPPPSLPAHPGNPPAPSRTEQRSSLSYRLSSDKSRVHQHAISGRDEGEVELSFQNAHAELGQREPEEMDFQQERLERPQVQRRGASLLDRLSTGNPRSHDPAAQQSLRDRLIPSKRDFEDMADEGMHHDVSFDGDDGTESKRARRKNGRARTRGGRRGGPA